ncbi:MAG: T9SS type A sorting domain-containing protein [Bacteroidota bacterium]|nr:T9SS type A sorting domain-containing protein [Bacteroidota bacterium]
MVNIKIEKEKINPINNIGEGMTIAVKRNLNRFVLFPTEIAHRCRTTSKFVENQMNYIFIFIICITVLPYLSICQTWTKIIPQFSTSDTSVDLSYTTFASKYIGWTVDNYYDSVNVLHSKIYRTTDGGFNWFLQRELISVEYFWKAFCIDSLTCWLLGECGTLLKSSNGGIQWDSIKITNFNPYLDWPFGAIYFFDSSEGLAFNQFTWSTSNGGYNWEKRDTNTLLPGVENITFADKNVGWVACLYNPWVIDAGSIAKTTNGGYSWFFQGDTISNNMIITAIMYGVDCIDTNIVYGIGHNVKSDGFFLSTTNGGEKWNWKRLYGPVYDIKFYNAITGWIVGWGGNIWNTKDSGATWTRHITGINSDLRKINILPHDNVIYISGENSTLLRANITTDVRHQNEIPKEFSLSQNYPNPFNTQTYIEFSLPKRELMSIEVYDLLGRKLKTLLNEYCEPGKHGVMFDASGMTSGVSSKGGYPPDGRAGASGVYFYSMITTARRITKKMLIIQ